MKVTRERNKSQHAPSIFSSNLSEEGVTLASSSSFVSQIISLGTTSTHVFDFLSSAISGSYFSESSSISVDVDSSSTLSTTPSEGDDISIVCVQQSIDDKETILVEETNSGEGESVFTLDEVSFHDTPVDCWLVVYDNVYDITPFLGQHPGADEVILEYAGCDATLAFKSVGHSRFAEEMLESYRIGRLVEEERIWRTRTRSTCSTSSNDNGERRW